MDPAGQIEIPTLWWGINSEGGPYYAGRVHVASDIAGTALCGLPIEDVRPQRPPTPMLCPDCCITAMTWLFPSRPPIPAAPAWPPHT